jgi:hypothetical protein
MDTRQEAAIELTEKRSAPRLGFASRRGWSSLVASGRYRSPVRVAFVPRLMNQRLRPRNRISRSGAQLPRSRRSKRWPNGQSAHRKKPPGKKNSSADTAVATIFRLRSKREGMHVAGPASRSATPPRVPVRRRNAQRRYRLRGDSMHL